MINNDYLSTLRTRAHTPHIAVTKELALAPRTLITIGRHARANIARQLKTQRLKITLEARIRIFHNIQ